MTARPELAKPDELTLVDVAALTLRERRFLARCTATGVVLGMIVWALTPIRFESRSSLMAEARSQPNLTGLAAQFGIALAPSEASLNPLVYVDLLRSRSLLGSLVDTPLPRTKSQDSVSIEAVFGATGATAELRRKSAIDRLQDNIQVSANTRTGVVDIVVTAPTAAVALDINRHLIALLDDFNLRRRQSQAAAERRFTERRLAEAKDELRLAEDQLLTFLQRNRNYQSAPSLVFEFDRRSREVAMRQQVVNALAQAHEQARIEEVRDTPAITVLEPPELPLLRRSRRAVVKTVVGAAILWIIGFFVAVSRFQRRRLDHGGEPAERMADLWRAAKHDLLRPWLLFGRNDL